MYVGDETFTSNLTYVLGLILKAQTYLLILPDIVQRQQCESRRRRKTDLIMMATHEVSLWK